MTTSPAPRRIEWTGPEGWTVWADEDGVHVRAAGGHCLEMPDVQRLFDLWGAAREAVSVPGRLTPPTPPTRDEVRQWSLDRVESQAIRRAVKALRDEFGQPENQPF